MHKNTLNLSELLKDPDFMKSLSENRYKYVQDYQRKLFNELETRLVQENFKKINTDNNNLENCENPQVSESRGVEDPWLVYNEFGMIPKESFDECLENKEDLLIICSVESDTSLTNLFYKILSDLRCISSPRYTIEISMPWVTRDKLQVLTKLNSISIYTDMDLLSPNKSMTCIDSRNLSVLPHNFTIFIKDDLELYDVKLKDGILSLNLKQKYMTVLSKTHVIN